MLVRQSQKGSALIYILIAIALLAALTATFMDSSSGQRTTAQETFNIVTQLNSQANFIRSAIQECVLTYPNGDTTMPADPVGNTAVYPVRPYPLQPNNDYLASPTVKTLAKDIRCPGNPGNSNNHAKIFGSNTGKLFPPSPKFFGDWRYFNSKDGVSLFIGSDTSDAFIGTALQKLDAQFTPCEAQYIDAASAAVNVVSDQPGMICGLGVKCILIHLVTTPTTLYPGETSCP